MIFKQLLDEDLGCASYLVGDEDDGTALVVDPPYAIEPLVAAAELHHLRIVRTLETHTHADHVSGHGRLALELEVPVSIHAAAAVGYPHEPLANGDELVVGAVRVRVLHTPGHRPEHCSFALVDGRSGTKPVLVLTGDSLFVGDAARPDLAVDAAEGAEGLFGSVHRLAELPDEVELFPGHVAGSLCGAALSSQPSSTIGLERRSNRALLVPELRQFVAELTSTLPPRPPNMERIVELNRGPLLGAQPPLETLTLAPAAAVVLDVRAAATFGAGHVAGAINVPVDGGSFATRAGFVLPLDRPIVLHGEAGELERATRGLRSVGFLDLAGQLVNQPTNERLEAVGLDEARRLVATGAVQLVDVREDAERARSAIPGSLHVPFRLVRSAVRDGLVDGKPVVTICESGTRAGIAASVLAAEGIEAHPLLEAGVGAWLG